MVSFFASKYLPNIYWHILKNTKSDYLQTKWCVSNNLKNYVDL
ncbi:hypothetical protein M23134_03167 [Microscilla marina ATCC 23134]|uniref:Uncharacterized protein n=1 Tax=Microscilla marina ATCC 23134 TaxID=313606 RepID=A1ZGB4_MICM2|nr:hypothetical protein M23134_03167 [Microscilla marina ATCC 23134]